MVRSRSRSPRWKRRSLSPAFRNQEHNRQRHNDINYDCEYKRFWKDAKKPMPWRMEDGKHGQINSRYASHETNHHRLYECRSYSPTLKRIPSEDIHSHKPCRTRSPVRNENIRRYQFPPRHSEMSRKEHNHSFYLSKIRDREMHEDTQAVGNIKETKTFLGPLGTSCKFERKWNENNLRHHQLQEDKYIQSPRRFSNEFMPRSSFQKRYPEDREHREYGHTSKRAKEMERYDDKEIASNSKWKQDHSSTLNQAKGEPRNIDLPTHRPVVKEYSDSCQTKMTYDYSQKRHRHPDGGKYVSEERAEKYMKVEEKKYNYPKETWNSKYLNYYNSERVGQVEEPRTEVSVKYISGTGCDLCTKSYKRDVDILSFDQKDKERIKKEVDFRGRKDCSSGHHYDTHHKISDVKVSDGDTRKEKLTVKVDMKKTINKYRSASSHIMERQTSCDLVAVGRKTESFHPVFEHIKSVTQKVEQNPSKEFAQEIITIIHQVKANYFKSSDLTLHERFSKLQDKPVANEVKRHSDPEIHRRIDMSLAELQNKRAVPCESEQSVVRVLEDPNDLRHDIERRRKERLQNEDENNFYIDGVSQRDEQSCSFSKLQNSQMYGFQNPARFLRPPFRKFIRKPHMGNIGYDQFEDETEHSDSFRRPFKPYFIDGRSHFKSSLVQKGLYIQAKYQRLRYAGTRGFTTNKFRGGFLRKEKDLEI
ncbi:BCLAF1 and THRAP3 family member 3 [Rhineura floridana]|uniref:BCLAF1 and THRAP3 family member 3 n=1 Tax=Rhineura floridana TaxID=261503 RepID=UPI002AC7FA24|nr:BCLAF1 and THRAP3 family member 3 [Rhineura floridana]XP_061483253.1 BCLAF1 and THRAP3 family member 3 [Rhineura floridana]XP_061483254.1 BCLAF1 and THRAP3 family member 3 [Rhineura floridana]